MSKPVPAARVLGPYCRESSVWIVVLYDAKGKRRDLRFPTERDALDEIDRLKQTVAEQNELTIQQAMDAYELYLRFEKGNKPGSVYCTVRRLTDFFLDPKLSLHRFDPSRGEACYAKLRSRVAVDTHRNTLAQAKSFFTWCVTKKKWLKDNPLDGVEGVGRRKKGKPQPRIDEARRWTAKALDLAARGESGAVAALMTLLMSMRCSEIVGRRVRDIDDRGRLLWITAAKTEAGKRALQVPKPLRPHLVALAKGKQPGELLFGAHWRDWPRRWVKKICRLVGIPEVTAHGMRGFHATVAAEQGITGHAIARAMGHESTSTTFGHYAQPKAVAKAKQDKVMAILADQPAQEPSSRRKKTPQPPDR